MFHPIPQRYLLEKSKAYEPLQDIQDQILTGNQV